LRSAPKHFCADDDKKKNGLPTRVVQFGLILPCDTIYDRTPQFARQGVDKSISSRLPDEAFGSPFFIRTAKNGPVAPSDPHFYPDLGFHPSGEPMSSQTPRGALGESGGNKSVENVEENSRVPGGPELSARKADRCPHRIVFRTL
jgi:hypothetical protein